MFKSNIHKFVDRRRRGKGGGGGEKERLGGIFDILREVLVLFLLLLSLLLSFSFNSEIYHCNQ